LLLMCSRAGDLVFPLIFEDISKVPSYKSGGEITSMCSLTVT